MVWTSVVKALFSMPCGSLHGVCYSLKEQIGEEKTMLSKKTNQRVLDGDFCNGMVFFKNSFI